MKFHRADNRDCKRFCIKLGFRVSRVRLMGVCEFGAAISRKLRNLSFGLLSSSRGVDLRSQG